MSMTDKEISLELNKAYIEHLNRRIDVKASHSQIDIEHVKRYYKTVFDTVSSVDKPAKVTK